MRVLLLGKREISEEEWKRWYPKYNEAKKAINDRKFKLASVAEMIEKDIQIVGGTAIEDKLQVGVPDTIKSIRQGGVKLWVLTGDKTETAINIGYSCGVLTNELRVLRFEANNNLSPRENKENILNQLASYDKISGKDYVKADDKIAIVITGPALNYILSDTSDLPTDQLSACQRLRMKSDICDRFAKMCACTCCRCKKGSLLSESEAAFLNLAHQAEVLIACRVSPAQKANASL